MVESDVINVGTEQNGKDQNSGSSKGRKDKSRNMMTIFEARLAKVEFTVADSRDKFEELGQSIEGREVETAELRGEMQATLNFVADELRKYIDSKYSC